MKNEVIYLYSIFIIIVAFFLLNSLPPMDYILIGLLITAVVTILNGIENHDKGNTSKMSTLAIILSLLLIVPSYVILNAYTVYIAIQFMVQYVSSDIALLLCILTLIKIKEEKDNGRI